MILQYASTIEQRIAKGLVSSALLRGLSVSVSDGEEVVVKQSTDEAQILAAMNSTDMDLLKFFKDGKRIGWIALIWGNDEDLIHDHSVGSEDIDAMVAAFM